MKQDNASMKRSFVVDLAGVQSAARLHDALAAQLPLPQHYGRNLDAFHDVLAEFGGSWSIVFRNAGAAADGLRAVCADAMAETPGLVIVFEADGAKMPIEGGAHDCAPCDTASGCFQESRSR